MCPASRSPARPDRDLPSDMVWGQRDNCRKLCCGPEEERVVTIAHFGKVGIFARFVTDARSIAARQILNHCVDGVGCRGFGALRRRAFEQATSGTGTNTKIPFSLFTLYEGDSCDPAAVGDPVSALSGQANLRTSTSGMWPTSYT